MNGVDANGGNEERRKQVQEVEPVNVGKRAQPATEKERGSHRANDDHVGVLAEEIECPAEAAVFGHVAGDQFGFRFGKIERRAIGFGDRSDNIDEKCHGREKDIPHVIVVLRVDDGVNRSVPASSTPLTIAKPAAVS